MKIFQNNICDEWKKNILSSKQRIIFLSPYVTSNIAEEILINAQHRNITLYTLFKSENFINMSSSLDTIKKLKNNGVNIFHIDNLHAKILIKDNEFITIGSQNLTDRGLKNREINITSQNESVALEVYEQIKNWLNDSVHISDTMINDMMDFICPKVKKYQAIVNLCKEKDEEIFKCDRKRLLKQIYDSISIEASSLQKSDTIKCYLKIYDHSPDFYIDEFGSKIFIEPTVKKTLTPVKRKNLLTWKINGECVNLNGNHRRYMFLIPEIGKLAWARVNKGRITFFEDSLKIREKILKKTYFITFESLWDIDCKHNIQITLRPYRESEKIVYQGWFGVSFIQKLTINKKLSMGASKQTELIRWIEKNSEKFLELLASRILTPFKYKKNLTGKSAEVFLNNYDGFIDLQLAKINNNYIFTAKL